MAAGSVLNCPAVRITLERLADLEKELRGGGIPCEESLGEIANAIKELETSRKVLYDELEVETIEVGKLRHQLLCQSDDIGTEISAGVAAARDANTAQLNQLRTEIKNVVEEIEFMERRRKLLEEENATLQLDREPMKDSQAEIIDQLNCQLSEKATSQIALNELRNGIQITKEKTAQVEAARRHLTENMAQERKRFAETKGKLLKEITGILNTIQEQKKMNMETRRDLDNVSAELADVEEKLRQKLMHISQLETTIASLSLKHKEQLEDESKMSEELDGKIECLEKELQVERDTFQQKIQSLQEKTAVVENQLEEGQKVKSIHLESITQLSESFRAQRKSEDDALKDQHSVSTELEGSKQRLEEILSSIAKNRLGVKEMEEEMKQLQDVRKVNKELTQKNLEQLEVHLAKEQMSRAAFEAEREELGQSLKSLREHQEQLVRDLSSDIALMKEKHHGLQEEKRTMKSLINQLTSNITTAEEQCREMEAQYREEIQQLTLEAESISRARLDQEEELKVQESVMKEAEGQFEVDLSRHQKLKTQTAEMKTRKRQLELFIQQMAEKTAELLKPKEDLQRRLQTLRDQRTQRLINNTATISTTEKNIYQSGVILEQVGLENSRLQLRIEQMKEDICSTGTEKEKHCEQKDWMKKEVQFLSSSLKKAWATDKLATEKSIHRDQKLLTDWSSFMVKIQQRNHRIGDISTRLERELMGLNSLFQRNKPP